MGLAQVALGALFEDKCNQPAVLTMATGGILMGAIVVVLLALALFAVADICCGSCAAAVIMVFCTLGLTVLPAFAAYACFNEHEGCSDNEWKSMGGLNIVAVFAVAISLPWLCFLIWPGDDDMTQEEDEKEKEEEEKRKREEETARLASQVQAQVLAQLAERREQERVATGFMAGLCQYLSTSDNPPKYTDSSMA
tara:strand:+ start:61 stop:645 length:585 start_codon:yes stop_codon:yes gene_type:complete